MVLKGSSFTWTRLSSVSNLSEENLLMLVVLLGVLHIVLVKRQHN